MRLLLVLVLLLPSLPAGAMRIVSLAPNVTELVFAAGAGDSLVGVSEWSDYPPRARDIVRVGDAFRLDYERILSLQPDLAVTWESGTPRQAQDRLRSLGVPVLALRLVSMEDVAAGIETLGRLAGTQATADAAAAGFRAALGELESSHRNLAPVRVFVQLDDEPLFTVTGRHLISQMVGLCGGVNVFAGLPGVAPAVDLEAVLAADPEVILYAGPSAEPALLWARWARLAAVRNAGVHRVDADLVTRASPRASDGARAVCRILDRARTAGSPHS